MTPEADTASPARIWRGWDAPEHPTQKAQPAPGLDRLDPLALIERIVLTAPPASQDTLRAYLRHKLESGRKQNSVKGIGLALAKFARALESVGATIESTNAAEISTARARMLEGLAATSRQLHVTHIRAFHRWRNDGQLPREVRVATPLEDAEEERTPTPATKAEFEKLLAACDGLRGEHETRVKALLWLLWDTGIHRRELLGLRLGDIQLDPSGDVVLALSSSDGATARRTILLDESVPYLAAWLAAHPCPRDPAASLWPSPADPRVAILKGGLNATLARLSRRAGTRTIQPRDLREARIARAAADGWHESRMRAHFGWSPTSTRPVRFTAALHSASPEGATPVQP